MFNIVNTLDLSSCPEALQLLESVGKVETVPARREEVLTLIDRADAYLSSLSVKVDAEMIRSAKRLKVIGSPATGTDHLDLAAIEKAGITCFNISKEHDLLRGFTATSELAFGLILALNRHLIKATDAASHGVWAREKFSGFQLFGKTLGVLGMGRLGKISARIANGFGMRVLAYDPVQSVTENVEWTDFDSLFRQSDILTIHVHLTKETHGLVDARALSLMKPTALLINTSRGGVVDESDLLEALQTGRILGAGLDVITGEWSVELADHALLRYSRDNSNLIITPHIGGATKESIYGARVFMAKKVAKFLREFHLE